MSRCRLTRVGSSTELVAPSRTGELFGREADAARLAERLHHHRLVTLTGPGGVGKTHLAVAATRPGDLGEPVFCALSEVTDPHAVRHAVAASLDLAATAEPLGTRVPPPDGDRVLVVLDNCEHVIDAAVAVTEELLAAEHVAVLATSREPLQLPGEQVVTLAPLPVPDPADPPETVAHAPAVELFAARAQAVRDDFRLDESTLPTVAEVCRALDGLPLALEIAAARVRSLSVEDVAARLVRRFTLLRSSTRSLPARHRSLHAVVEWSYGLLDDEERALFDTLAGFPGGCDLDAVVDLRAALGLDHDPLDLVDSLVARSLVTATRARGVTRYSMLDTLRAYGLERLAASGRLDSARDLHADLYARVYGRMHQLGLRAWTPALVPLFDEFDNARAALERALAVDASPDRAYEILVPLWYLALQHRCGEIAEMADRVLSRWGRTPHPRLSEVLATAATARLSVDEVEAGAALARAAVEADTSPVGAAWAWGALARADKRTGADPEQALAHLDAADRAAEAAGFEPYRCDLMGHRVTVLYQAGRDDDALACARDALAMAERQGNAYEHAWTSHLVAALLATTLPTEALRWADAALAESEPIGYVYGINASYRVLGVVTTELGDEPVAAGWFLRALDAFTRSGGVMERRATLAAALPLLVSTGRESLAADVLEVVDAGEGVVERITAPRLDEVRHTLASARRPGDVVSRPIEGDRVLAAVRDALRSMADDPRELVPTPREPASAVLAAGVLRRTGELWTVTFAGTTAPVRRSKGLEDIAVLLARPSQEVAALDLASGQGATVSSSAGENLHEPGDLGEVADAPARAAYAARIKDLQAALDDADAVGDAERGSRLQAELDELTHHLAAAYGLHGPRRAGDPAERARAAVTARIRAAIAKVADAHPALGRHLGRSIRTGRFCSYRPDESVVWTIDDCRVHAEDAADQGRAHAAAALRHRDRGLTVTTNPDVDAWFAERQHPLEDAMQLARRLILDADSRVTESVKWKAPTYSFNGNIVSFNPSKKLVSLLFHRGAAIPGDFPRLVGDGRLVRTMRFADVGEVEQAADELQAVIRAWCALHE
jgi:predicted ATPase